MSSRSRPIPRRRPIARGVKDVAHVLAVGVFLGPLLAGCTVGGNDSDAGGTPTEPTGSGAIAREAPSTTRPDPSTPPTTQPQQLSQQPQSPQPPQSPKPPPPKPVGFYAANAMQTVQTLAGQIGPREATSPAFRRAAQYMERTLARASYDVRRQTLRVPAGNSWGVAVPAGRTSNVIATPPGFDPRQPFRIVGAHLDTVPQAPGAEDNASGVAVMLELARLAARQPPETPVVFVAFGAEEPRGEGDSMHHFGSRAMVARMPAAWRDNLVAMVSLDRVGVGTAVPLSSGGLEPPTVRAELMRVASRAGIAAVAELNQSSDHWSFDKAGLPAARIGSTPYAAYHSAADLPAVVSRAQIRRVGTLTWTWLR